jgi:hypothetical protein
MRVRASETDAGVRCAALLPVPRVELATLKAGRDESMPYVFLSAY